MIDINLGHAEQIMGWFEEATAEHYGYADELYSLDLSDEVQALYAIKKWMSFDSVEPFGDVEVGNFLIMESCRFNMTLSSPFSGYYLPGIDYNLSIKRSPAEEQAESFLYHQKLNKFQLLVWDHVFKGVPYEPAILENYRSRVDRIFCARPYWPDLWEEPKYAPWPWKKLVPWDPVTGLGAWNY